MTNLRSADRLLASAVAETLAALDLVDTDTAAGRLARTYAEQIDADPALLATLGPKLLATLDALLATPGARAKVKQSASDEVPGAGQLAALRSGVA